MLSIIIIGAGINGVTAAIELKRRGHAVTLFDPGPIPHPAAASTDISKAVRSCYGADEDYTALAERAIARWREWNRQFGTELYHESGVLFLTQAKMERGGFEYETLRLLKERGHRVERLRSDEIRRRFPVFNSERFHDGVYDPEGGYAESGRAVTLLLQRALEMGVAVHGDTAFAALDEANGGLSGILTTDGRRFPADAVVAATGSWTPHLFPSTAGFFRSTGHPVFHLRPNDPAPFTHLPMFGTDISETAYYGFPAMADGVVKLGSHGAGREMAPDAIEQRVVTQDEKDDLREFLSWAIPELAPAPVSYTRICLYCDTNDGDFWISPDPGRPGFFIAAGDSGHGFKFAPVLGELIADCVEGKVNPLLHKFRWRPGVPAGQQKEAARYLRK